jgi:enamine deaminase RidA (YjgF/YER057c/UK114 family)
MPYRRFLTGAVLSCLALLCVGGLFAAKKKKTEDVTQTLALPKEPPQVAVGETRRLVFHVSPLSGKGPLAQQTRDALRALLRLNGGLPVIHIRAFVAGSGDVRRVPQLVSEVFGDKRGSLPSVSVVRAGGLPAENAQVVLESISVAKRDLSSSGLDFIATEPVTAPDPLSSAKPLLLKALDQLAAKLNGQSALAVSCFVSNLSDAPELTSAVIARFPGAAANIVQTQRGPGQALAICEAVARGNKTTAEKLAFSGTRVAFGSEEKDAALSFQRLDRDLSSAGASAANLVLTHIYPLSASTGIMSRKLLLATRPGNTSPITVIPFEGLAAIDAGFALDAIAAVSQ